MASISKARTVAVPEGCTKISVQNEVEATNANLAKTDAYYVKLRQFMHATMQRLSNAMCDNEGSSYNYTCKALAECAELTAGLEYEHARTMRHIVSMHNSVVERILS